MHTRSSTRAIELGTHTISNPLEFLSTVALQQNLLLSKLAGSSCKPISGRVSCSSFAGKGVLSTAVESTPLEPLGRSFSSNKLTLSCRKRRGVRGKPYERPAHISRIPSPSRTTGISATTSAVQYNVLRMIFNEVTPYPSIAWVSLISALIGKDAKQVKIWFSNARQKDNTVKRDGDLENSSSAYDIRSTVCKVSSRDGDLRLRRTVLETFSEEEWSNDLFKEIVMIYHMKVLVQHNGEEEIFSP